MRPDALDHRAHVEAWLDRAIGERTPPAAQLISLFERATNGLWQRAQATLGEVTMVAIVDRVLYTALEKSPVLASLTIVGASVSFDEFRHRWTGDASGLRELIGWVLAEFLTVVGHLTDEILTPGLRAELSRIDLEEEESTSTESDKGAKGAQS